MTAARKRRLALAVKIAIGGLLIAWLVRSGTLDLGALALFGERPTLLAADLAVFVFTTVLGGLRWRLLLRLVGVDLPVGRTMQLAYSAVFFNVALPGNIGGDVLKSIYVARAADPEQRAGVYVVALLDRLLALAGLVVVASALTFTRGSVWADPHQRQLATAIAALLGATIVAPIVLLLVVHRFGTRLDGWTRGASPVKKLVARLVAVARLVSAGPTTLIIALGFAITAHLAGMLLFSALASAITGHDVSVSSMASVYPLGMLSVVLPISYAGFGVGHVAFDQLFALVGLTGGATVLNVYLIGQTVPCVLGVLPYLTLRSERGTTDETEPAAGGS